MTEHRCQFIEHGRGMCERIAHCTYNEVWFCADHYDRLVTALGPETWIMGGADYALEDTTGKLWWHYGGA